MKGLARLIPCAFALVLSAGCQIILFSWPAGEPVPNVVGTWRGVWLVSSPLPMQVVIAAFSS